MPSNLTHLYSMITEFDLINFMEEEHISVDGFNTEVYRGARVTLLYIQLCPSEHTV